MIDLNKGRDLKKLFLFTLLFGALFFVTSKIFADDALMDQSSFALPSNPAFNGLDTTKYCQSFIPNINNTTSISIYIKNNVIGKKIGLSVYTMGGRSMNFAIQDATGSFKWENFVLQKQTEENMGIVHPLEKGTQYKLCVMAQDPAVSWAYSTPSNYSKGIAMRGNDVIANTDMAFVTYGYDIHALDNSSASPAQGEENVSQLDQGSVNSDKSNTSNKTDKPSGMSNIAKHINNNLGLANNSKSQENLVYIYIIGIGLIELIVIAYLTYRYIKKKKVKNKTKI